MLLAVLSLCVCCAGMSTDDPKVIYGNDDRKDYFELSDSDPFKNLTMRSIASLFHLSGSRPSRFDVTLDQYPSRLGSAQSLCSDQKFLFDPTAAFCSGTLVGPDLVVTAGHCLTGAECGGVALVFGYYATSRNSTGYPRFPVITGDDIYLCTHVYTIDFDGTDFAVIHLDRPVNNVRAPVIRSTRQTLSIGQSITMIGFPDGIPAKIDSGGKVMGIKNSVNFIGSIDSFTGNSGSGIFSSDGTMVGILNHGEVDYKQRSGEACYEVNTLSNSCLDCGEFATFAFHTRNVIDCKSDQDCTSQTFYKSSTCARSCSASSSSCTGFCVPANQMGKLSCLDFVYGTTYTAPNSVWYAGGDHIFTFEVMDPTDVVVDGCLSPTNLIIGLFHTNNNTLISSCVENCGCSGSAPRVSMKLQPGNYTIVLDSASAEDGGNYKLRIGCNGTLPSETGSATHSRAAWGLLVSLALSLCFVFVL